MRSYVKRIWVDMNLSLELCLGFSLVWPQIGIRTQGTESQRTANQVELQASSELWK
jgi:hypothetical protein